MWRQNRQRAKNDLSDNEKRTRHRLTTPNLSGATNSYCEKSSSSQPVRTLALRKSPTARAANGSQMTYMKPLKWETSWNWLDGTIKNATRRPKPRCKTRLRWRNNAYGRRKLSTPMTPKTCGPLSNAYRTTVTTTRTTKLFKLSRQPTLATAAKQTSSGLTFRRWANWLISAEREGHGWEKWRLITL